MSLIEKIDAMDIAPFLTVDMNIGYQTAIRDIKQIILSSQKELFIHDACDGCLYEEKNNDEYPCNHCKQCYIDQWKPKLKPTIGDKIRESNEGLAEFIKRQFAGDRVFINGEEYDIEDYLNQLYEER